MAASRATRRIAAAALGAAVAFAAIVVAAPPAAAHSALVASDPAADAVLDRSPDAIRLDFNEPVSVAADGVRLLGVDGTELDLDAVEVVDTRVTVPVRGELDDGSYVVAWKVASADGHPVTGAFTFAVGAPSGGDRDLDELVAALGAPSPGARAFADAATVATYAGVLVAAGAGVFEAVLLGGGTVAGGVGGVRRRRIRSVVVVGAAAGAVGLVVSIVAAAILAGGGGLRMPAGDAVADAATGAPGLQALVGCVGLALVVAAVPSEGATRRPAVLAGALLAVGALSIVGHTRTASPLALAMAADVAHVAAAATWTGGLVALAVALGATGVRDDAPVAAVMVARFSAMAAAAIVAVATAGALLGWRILGSWSALWNTTYGTLLLVKLALFAGLAALGAYNRFALVPRVGEGPDGVARLRTVLVAEVALVVAVVAVTGVLTSRPPTDDAAAFAEARRRCLEDVAAMEGLAGMEDMDHSCPGDPTTTTTPGTADVTVLEEIVAFGEGSVVIQVGPGAVGANEVRLAVRGVDGALVDTARAPVLRFRLREQNIGPLEVTTERLGTGRYVAVQDLALAGTWELNVTAVVSDFEQPQAIVTFDVGG